MAVEGEAAQGILIVLKKNGRVGQRGLTPPGGGGSVSFEQFRGLLYGEQLLGRETGRFSVALTLREAEKGGPTTPVLVWHRSRQRYMQLSFETASELTISADAVAGERGVILDRKSVV